MLQLQPALVGRWVALPDPLVLQPGRCALCCQPVFGRRGPLPPGVGFICMGPWWGDEDQDSCFARALTPVN